MSVNANPAVLGLVLFADGFDMHGDFGAGWWILMMVGMVLFWTLVVVGVVWVVRELSRGRASEVGTESAVAVLERRFAAGEISADEYRERRSVLAGESERPPGG